MKTNLHLKTLLVVAATILLFVPGLLAQGRGGSGGRGGFSSGARGGSYAAAHSSFAGRPAARAGYNNAAYRGGPGGRSFRGSYLGRGGYHRGGGHHGGYGRYYYLGGIPYFYPFYGYGFGYGFGYPSYYGNGFYGEGYGAYGAEGGYGTDGGSDDAEGGHAYQGRITNGQNGGAVQGSGSSLPTAVQRQLSKRGYYRGNVDGQFGPASRDALKRFQKSQGLKETGRIDEDSLDALGFTDKR